MTYFTHSGYTADQPNNPKKFDLLTAIEHAEANNIEGVQLYLNKASINPVYMEDLISRILYSNLKEVIIHLPNFDDPIIQDFVHAADTLTKALRVSDIKIRTLIHFGFNNSELQYRHLPKVDGNYVYIENSLTGIFDPEHVKRAIKLAKAHDTGIVLDVGRFAYPPEDGIVDVERYVHFVSSIIKEYIQNPRKLIIHTAGKTRWGKYRDFACAHGHKDDIFKPIYKILTDFERAGGSIVIESENEDQVLDSIKFLKAFES